LYDSYDRANDTSARKFLLASIASPLSSQILEGHFIRGAPTLKDQELQHQVSLLHNQVQRLIRTVESLRTPMVHNRNRKGENVASAPCRNPPDRSPPASRPRRNHAAYQSIPANGHHNLGNTRLTHKQVRAAQKIATHCNMARNGGIAEALRMAIQPPRCFRQASPKEEAMSIIWDSGTSISLSFDYNDFVGVLKPAELLTCLQGYAKD
jgi:hypothetical protein